MERRSFLKATCAACGVVAAISILDGCKKNSSSNSVNFTLDLTSSANAALSTVGGSVHSNGVIVIRVSSSGYAALSDSCTHQGCTVNYDNSTSKLVCPCHGGTFNTSGTVLGGPPPSPLAKYNVSQSGNILTITS